MREYELMFIVAQRDIKEGTQEKVIEEVRIMIEDMDGRVLRVRPWGLRQLAYEIEGHDYGYYVIMQFVLDPAILKQLEGKLRMMGTIIRSLVLQKGERSGEEIEEIIISAESEEEIDAAMKVGVKEERKKEREENKEVEVTEFEDEEDDDESDDDDDESEE